MVDALDADDGAGVERADAKLVDDIALVDGAGISMYSCIP